ncbi:MAG TPA: HAMP domain-containing sensor histidine kinase [Gaiellales bacterium]|nr:HAMP domain-containing sensor histidine kinase [Gaiellales bacterium]
MSFRLRLTLASAAAVALAVAVACAIAYIVVGQRLYGQVDSALRSEATAAVQQMSPPTYRIPSPELFSSSDNDYMQAVTAGGDIWARSPNTRGRLPVTQAALDAARTQESLTLQTMTVQGVHLRVATVSLGNGLSLQIARRLTDADIVLRQLRIWFLLVAAGGVALAALLGAFVAREALRPVRKLTETAENVAATHDLTQRIEVTGHDELSRLATSFNTMLAALEQAVAAQRQLVADASHELRTPLTSLRTNFEVLMRPAPLPEESRRKLEQDVHRQFDELTVLVGDIVELARDGQSPGEEDDVRLDVLVAEAIERAERNSADVNFRLDARPTLVRGVPGRLDRAVRNLLDNAAKWSPRGEVVEVDVGEGTVTVRDHGPGIAGDDLPFIFDRFYRSAEARSMPGSGLGLAIVRQVAEAHGGHVTVETAADGGTRFVFSVPPLPVPSEDLVDV